MTLGPNAGTAHVTVKPSLKGWSKSVRDQLGREKIPPLKVPVEPDGNPETSGRRAAEKYAGGFDRTVRTRIAAALKELPPVEIGVASSEAEQRIKDLRAELVGLSTKRIGVDVDAGQAVAQIAAVQAQLSTLSDESVNIDVKANTLLAATQLATIKAAAETVDRTSASIKVKTDSSVFGWFAQLGSRITVLGPILAAVAVAAIPVGAVLVSLAATAVSAFTAAAGGVGILLAAVLGAVLPVVKAQQELEQKQQQAASAASAYASAQNQVRSSLAGLASAQISASRSVSDASRALSEAQSSAARSIADAQRAVAAARRSAAQSIESAEDAVASAQARSRDAQQQLTQAREAARERLRSYEDQLRSVALAETGAALTVTAAQERLNEVLADPTSTQLGIDQARQALAEARFAYDESTKRRKDLRKQAAEDRRQGVSGDEAVQDARSRLGDANAALAEAEQNLSRARADGARAVAAAERSLGQARAAAAQSVADAERNLSRARADGARSVAAAEAQVAQSRAAAAEAGRAYADAQAEVNERLAKMKGPAAVFVAALDRAKDAWQGFVEATATSSFGLAAQALDLFTELLPRLVPLARGAAGAVGTLLSDIGDFFDGKTGRSFMRWLTREGPDAIVTIGRAFGNIAVGLGGMIGALTNSDTGFLKLTRRFADFGRKAGKNSSVRDFFEYAKRNGPIVAGAIGAIVDVLVAATRALAPIGSLMLRLMTPLYRAYAAFINLMSDPAAWAAKIAAPIGALVLLYRKVDWFADSVDQALSWVGDSVTRLWRGYLRPTFRAIGSFLQATWERVIRPALQAWWKYMTTVVAPTVVWLWKRVIKPIFGFVGDFIEGVWKRLIHPILQAWWSYMRNVLAPVLKWLWEKVVRPVFTWIGDKISTAWTKVIKPIFQALGDFLQKHVVPKLRSAIDTIGDIWDKLKKAAGTPVKFVVDTIYNNGLRKVINAIPGVTDVDPIDTSGWPSFATGGVMPGYTPGRDVHQFFSPTAGRLGLSGGEAIMRPEWTRMIGGEPVVNALNQAARKGKSALAVALQALAGGGDVGLFAGGGVVWPTTFRSLSPQYPGHTGIDISIPGTADYGLPVFAAHSGFARNINYGSSSYGNSVWLQGNDGFTTIYGHLSAAGRMGAVKAGDQIGNIGSTGNSTGPHLHFEVRPGGTPAAALSYLAGSPVFSGAKAASSGSSLNPLARFAAAISSVKDLAGKVPDWYSQLKNMGPWGDLLKKGVSGLGSKFRDWVNGKIPGPGPMPGVFDQGGLASGAGYLRKATIRPERVLSPDQTAAFERQVATLESWDRASRVLGAINPSGSGTQLQVTRFRIEDWEQGLASMEYVATAAAENVLAAQDSHDARIHDLDVDYAGV